MISDLIGFRKIISLRVICCCKFAFSCGLKVFLLFVQDILLCHDDELEGRRIAYIFYLVPKDWTASDGGIVVFI